jgi:Pvc16 N-terminal domain
MIDVALQFLSDELNAFLQSNVGLDAAKVSPSSVLNAEGKFAVPVDSVGASIINVEEERVVKTQVPQYVHRNGQDVISEPDLKLNLYVLFAANFQVYDQALKYLSLIIRYFQSQPSFTPEQFPALDPRIEKLVPELQSLSFDQWNQIWGANGGKQLPSILYKTRLVVIQPDVSSVRSPLVKIGTELHNA